MKIILFCILISINGFSQIENHKINLNSLQYRTVLKQERILSYSPLKKVKLTFKIVLNNSIISKVGGDIEDGFTEIEAEDAVALIKYDARAKIYISKRWRFLMRTQIMGFNKSICTAGFYWKFKK